MLTFRSRALVLWLLFGVVTGGFVLYRNCDIYVWDDTPALVLNTAAVVGGGDNWQTAELKWRARRSQLSAQPLVGLRLLLNDAFGGLQLGGYRPLNHLGATCSAYMFEPAGPPLTLLLIYGSVYGAFAVCLFLIARRFTSHDATALLAVVLIFGAPPLVCSSWHVTVGLQAMVPLLICAALLLYWQAVEAPRHRWLYTLGLCAVLFIGPWFREFTGISCLLVVAMEIRRTRRPTLMMGLACLLLLHAVFPTALVKWLFYPNLPLLPVTRLGNLGGAINQGSAFHWFMSWQFVPLVPPLLLALASLNCVRIGSQELICRMPRSWQDCKNHAPAYLARVVLPALWLLALCVVGIKSLSSGQMVHDALGFVLCLGVAAAALQIDPFLCVWFLLSFVPLMRVATQTVHFFYALVPASIILACSVESLWTWAAARTGWLRAVRYAVALAGGIVVLDQSLVIYGGYRVMHGQNAGIRAIAAQLRQQAPPGSVVISNAIHGVEILWTAGGEREHFWTMPWGAYDPDRVIDDCAKLEKLLADKHGKAKVFFLDCDYEYLPWKLGHRHKFVHSAQIDIRPAGEGVDASSPYPFADPLRYFTARQNVPFLGSPDLENDFYKGPARGGRWFLNEVYVKYQLYEVTGTQVYLEEPPALALQGFHEFNIISCNGKYYGLPQSAGGFDFAKVRSNAYPVCFCGRTIDEVKKKIEALPARAEPDASAPQIKSAGRSQPRQRT